jgi:hypothetical protein
VREIGMKDGKPEASYLAPKEIAEELGVARTTVDRLMLLDPEHPDFLEHVEWVRYRSGAKRRRVSKATWEAWKERHLVRGKNTQAPVAASVSDRQFKFAPKSRESFTKVLQKSGANGEAVENKRETQGGTGL